MFLLGREVAGLGDLEGELFQAQGEIDIGNNHAWVQLETAWGEVENSVDAIGDESIGHALSGIGRNSDDTQPDPTVLERCLEFGDRLNGSFVENEAPGCGIRIEYGGDVKIELVERTVGKQGTPDVACSDQCGIPDQIATQYPTQILMQLSDVVPDTGMPELADEGEVLADLRVRQPEQRSNLLGTDHGSIRVQKNHELSQIEAEPSGGGSGNVLLDVHVKSLSRTSQLQ